MRRARPRRESADRDRPARRARRRAHLEALPDVEVAACSDTAAGLPPGSADLVFLCDVHHRFERPEPGKASAFVLHHVRAPKATVRAGIEAAGFAFEREESFLRENHFLSFRRTR